MTFEEFEKGLDRLKERHEALTLTVELLAHDQREWFEKTRVWQEKNEKLMAEVVESIHSLARIAHAHEPRISDLEDN